MTPEELLPRLSKLLPSQFEEVLYLAKIPLHHISGATAPQVIRAIELLRYAEQQEQLDQLARIVGTVIASHPAGDAGQLAAARLTTLASSPVRMPEVDADTPQLHAGGIRKTVRAGADHPRHSTSRRRSQEERRCARPHQ